jgi:hypothetical protein
MHDLIEKKKSHIKIMMMTSLLSLKRSQQDESNDTKEGHQQ